MMQIIDKIHDELCSNRLRQESASFPISSSLLTLSSCLSSPLSSFSFLGIKWRWQCGTVCPASFPFWQNIWYSILYICCSFLLTQWAVMNKSIVSTYVRSCTLGVYFLEQTRTWPGAKGLWLTMAQTFLRRRKIWEGGMMFCPKMIYPAIFMLQNIYKEYSHSLIHSFTIQKGKARYEDESQQPLKYKQMKIVFTLFLLILIKTTLTCGTSQYLNPSGTCQNCHYRCTTCSSYSNCQLCKSDYYIDGSTGQCFTCGEGCSCDGVTQNCDTSSAGYIILGAILGPFGVLLINVFCCFCCKEYEEEEQGEQYQDSSQNYITEVNLNPNKNVPLVGGLLSLHRRQWTTSQQTYTLDKTSTCSICLQQGVDFRTNCNHLFHIKCFAHWMRRSIHCPLCKGKVMRDLRKYCGKCGRNYVSLNVRNIDKYLMQFYEICIFCRDEIRMLQTLSQGEMSHQI